MKSIVALGVSLALNVVMVNGAAAQETSDNRVAARSDWSVFVDSDPTECWVVSAPKETINTRDDRVVSVRRGDIQMFVTYRPSAGVSGEVSFAGGYPFANGSTVQLAIGESKFELFTSGENAWAASTADDAKIITAMKRGAQAVMVGRSSRGTKTEDRFSLYGFTSALEEAEKRCSG